jgi:hypothetical protein
MMTVRSEGKFEGEEQGRGGIRTPGRNGDTTLAMKRTTKARERNIAGVLAATWEYLKRVKIVLGN